MSKYYESKEFKDLKQKWYKKLKESEFNDIETFVNKRGIIHTTPYVNSDIKNLYKFYSDLGHDNFGDYCHSTYLYYSACRTFLAYNAIPASEIPQLDLKILELHSNGLSIRKICKQLRTFICRYPRYSHGGNLYKHYSTMYVFTRLKIIKEQVRLWNLTHDEGIVADHYGDFNV